MSVAYEISATGVPSNNNDTVAANLLLAAHPAQASAGQVTLAMIGAWKQMGSTKRMAVVGLLCCLVAGGCASSRYDVDERRASMLIVGGYIEGGSALYAAKSAQSLAEAC